MTTRVLSAHFPKAIFNWFLLGTVLLISIITNGFQLRLIGQPWPGFFMNWNQGMNGAQVTLLNYPQAPGLASGEIRPGDIILRIESNSKSIGFWNSQEDWNNLFVSDVTQIQYHIIRNNVNYDVPGSIYIFTIKDLIDFRARFVFLGLSFWVLGLAILLFVPNTPQIQALFLFIVSISCQILPGPWELGLDLHTLSVWVTALGTVAFSLFIGASFIHFVSLFPYPIRGHKLIAMLSYLVAFILLPLYIYITVNTPITNSLFSLIDRISVTYTVATIGLGAVFLFFRCISILARKKRLVPYHDQSKIFLTTGIIGAIIPLILLAIYSIEQNYSLGFLLIRVPLILSLPVISISYWLLRYHNVRERKLLLGLIVFSGVMLLSQVILLIPGSVPSGMTIFQLVVIALATSWSLIGNNFSMVNSLFYREREGFKQLSNIINISSDIGDLENLIKIVQKIRSDFNSKYAALVLTTPDEDIQIFTDLLEKEKVTKKMIEEWKSIPEIATIQESFILSDFEDGPVPLSVIIPIFNDLENKGTEKGFFLIGPKENGRIFDSADLRLLSILGKQAGLTYMLYKRISQLKRARNQIITAVENERKSIADDLHDTVHQELERLRLAIDNIQFYKGKDNSSLYTSVYEKIGIIASQISNLRKDLYPIPLSNDLKNDIFQLSQRTLHSKNITINFDYRLETIIPNPVSLVLYRVCQEALNNITKHSGATAVTITLNEDDEQILCSINDNGKGFNYNLDSEYMNEMHHGIQIMRNRVESVGGTFSFFSGRSGTKVFVKLPVT